MNRALGHPMPWPAPGKLNLFLHIVGRRPDGYHELQTAFQFIDLWDSIRFYQRPPGVIERLGTLAGVPADQDLTVRAARRLAVAAAGTGVSWLFSTPGSGRWGMASGSSGPCRRRR